MPYDYTITNEGDHFRVEITGTRERAKEADDIIKVLFDVIDHGCALGICNILIVSGLSGHFPVLAALNVAESLENLAMSRKFKLANVALDEQSRHDIEFSETLAVNRGYRYRVFHNEQEAKTWLLGT